jgi:hypothetical protein
VGNVVARAIARAPEAARPPATAMNELRAYVESNPGRMIHKWMHYFEIVL